MEINKAIDILKTKIHIAGMPKVGRKMNREELLKISKPILFNTEMTQATLENTKTATRRVVKPQPEKNQFRGTYYWKCYRDMIGENEVKFKLANSPYVPCKIGDILYVKETWQIHDLSPAFCMMIRFRADNYCELQVEFKPSRFDKFEKFYFKNGWQSPYFMPKEAARIFLKVIDVRVERLQDINGCGLEKEGIKTGITHFKSMFNNFGNAERFEIAQEKFSSIWNSTIKKQDIDKYGWKANPWVWVIEFERMEI